MCAREDALTREPGGITFDEAAAKKMGLLLARPNQDLVRFIELLEAGKVAPVIDRRYPVDEVPEALRYLGEGRARGKVVITV